MSQRFPRSVLRMLVLVGLAASTLVVPTNGPLPGGAEPAAANSAFSDDAHPDVDVNTLDNIPVQTWGVTNEASHLSQTPSLDVEVWDIQQAGTRMFVGGMFLDVQEDRNTTPIRQAYLAAFDVNTGDWISSCRPVFDRTVYALTINAQGLLIVGGEFTTVNGTPREGLVALDPATCEIASSFEGALERPWSAKRAMARDLEVVDGELYVVGNFSHATGPGGQRERAYKAVRMDAATGQIDSAWKPQVAGSSVWALTLDTSRDRVHFTGFFSSVNGLAGSGNYHVVNTTNGATVPTPALPRNYPPSQPEMYDVAMGNDLVFVVGEQHIAQVLDADTQQMIGYHHTANANNGFAWTGHLGGGGAYQVAERVGDVVYAGCHCMYASYRGRPGSHYSSFDNTRRELKLIFAYDANTGHVIDSFDPDATAARDGAWAVASDTNGCLYVGGDYDNRGVRAQLGAWASGFIKMCPQGWAPPAGDPQPWPANVQPPPGPDVTPPTVPGDLTSSIAGTDVTLQWGESTDDQGLQSYLVYRDGAYLAWTPAGTETYVDSGRAAGATHTYQIRAVDQAGNRSSKNDPHTVQIPGDDLPPTDPTGLAATALGNGEIELTWQPSIDDHGLQSYLVYRNGAYIGWTPAGTERYVDIERTPGVSYTYQVRAVDRTQQRSAKSAPATITAQ